MPFRPRGPTSPLDSSDDEATTAGPVVTGPASAAVPDGGIGRSGHHHPVGRAAAARTPRAAPAVRRRVPASSGAARRPRSTRSRRWRTPPRSCPGARLGTAIAGVFTRGPALLAMSAAALAEAAPGRFSARRRRRVTGDRHAVERGPLRAPVSRRTRGGRVPARGAGAARSCRTGSGWNRPPAQPPPILVAALRPAMLRLAGAVGDGAILNWLSTSDVERVVPLVQAAGPGRRIVARIFVLPDRRSGAGPGRRPPARHRVPDGAGVRGVPSLAGAR